MKRTHNGTLLALNGRIDEENLTPHIMNFRAAVCMMLKECQDASFNVSVKLKFSIKVVTKCRSRHGRLSAEYWVGRVELSRVFFWGGGGGMFFLSDLIRGASVVLHFCAENNERRLRLCRLRLQAEIRNNVST